MELALVPCIAAWVWSIRHHGKVIERGVAWVKALDLDGNTPLPEKKNGTARRKIAVPCEPAKSPGRLGTFRRWPAWVAKAGRHSSIAGSGRASWTTVPGTLSR